MGIVERRSVPGVDLDVIVVIVSVVSRYEGGGSCCSSRVQKNKRNIKKSKHTKGTGNRDPLSFTFAAHLFVSELEEESSGIMTIECKCGWQDGSNEFQVVLYYNESSTASEPKLELWLLPLVHRHA